MVDNCTRRSVAAPEQPVTTEYEVAALALRESTLWVAIAQVAATLVIGAGQIGVVWYGIRAMQRAANQRAAATDAERRQADQRHTEAMSAQSEHHEEAMVALRVLIERTAPAGD